MGDEAIHEPPVMRDIHAAHRSYSSWIAASPSAPRDDKGSPDAPVIDDRAKKAGPFGPA
jgi:hypothetical protein